MLKSVWKNVIGIVALFSVIFCIFYFNFKIGFTAFDFNFIILTPITLSFTIVILSIFLPILTAILIILIIIYRKRKKLKMEK